MNETRLNNSVEVLSFVYVSVQICLALHKLTDEPRTNSFKKNGHDRNALKSQTRNTHNTRNLVEFRQFRKGGGIRLVLILYG